MNEKIIVNKMVKGGKIEQVPIEGNVFDLTFYCEGGNKYRVQIANNSLRIRTDLGVIIEPVACNCINVVEVKP